MKHVLDYLAEIHQRLYKALIAFMIFMLVVLIMLRLHHHACLYDFAVTVLI